jgi:DNA-binding GntR family transcriptional regulator
MNEVELATRLATSRGPVREAMQRLVQEGLLISAPHRGIWVRQLVQADLEDLYFARAAVERAAMLRLIDRGMPAGLRARRPPEHRMTELLPVENPSVSFGAANVLDDSSFSTRAGQAVAIVGESGSGRTSPRCR